MFNLHLQFTILKQLLYRENKKDLPYSRFIKIEGNDGVGIKKCVQIISIIMLAFLAIAMVYPGICYPRLEHFSDSLNQFLNMNEYAILIGYIVLSLIIVNIAYHCGIYFSHYMRIKEVKTANLCLEAKSDSKESVFDKYLDEILYFFEVRKYDVVFIEDLDRFENTEIFIRLRELNGLLNSSKRIKQSVVFVYALSDDVFKIATERTKFFDFIIPVMPFINGENTEGKFREKLIEILPNESEIEDDFIKEVSRYIKDMRMMYNICNEFYLYHKLHRRIGLPLKAQKLLALIVYKNFCPEDFSELQYGKGKVFDIFAEKKKFIKLKQEEKQQEIKQIQTEINELDKAKISNIYDWKLLFLNAITNQKINKIERIQYSSKSLSFTDFLNNEDDLLTVWGELKDLQVFALSVYGSQVSLSVDTNQVEQYKEKLDCIYNNNNEYIKQLEVKIKKIEEIIHDIDGYSLRTLINSLNDNDILSVFWDEKGNIPEVYKVVVYLLRHGSNGDSNGYIDETYSNYLTYFHKGGLSANDTNFLLSVQNQEALDFDYKLDDVARVADEVRAESFETRAVLNLALMDFLLQTKDDGPEALTTKKLNLFKFLSRESKAAMAFTKEYFDIGEYRDNFVYELSMVWENIWNNIEQQALGIIRQDKKDEYLQSILKNLPISQLIKLNNRGKLKQYLEKYGRIYYFSDLGDVNQKKFIRIINTLDIKFQVINDLRGKSYDVLRMEYNDLLKAILEGNHYEINEWMIINFVANVKKWDGEKVQSANYSTIKKSEDVNIIRYIDANFAKYINNAWLKLIRKQGDAEEYIIEMIEKSGTDRKMQEQIILKEEFNLSDITLLDQDLWNFLIKERKVAVQWMNLIQYIQYDQFDIDSLITFLNYSDRYMKLTRINKNDSSIKSEDVGKLIRNLCRPESNRDMLRHVFSCCPYTYEEIPISNAIEEQVNLLIHNSILAYNETNFKMARKYKDALCLFIQGAIAKKCEISSWELDNEDVFVLLTSDRFKTVEKYNFMLLIKKPIEKELAEKCLEVLKESPNPIPSEFYRNLFSCLDNNGKIQLIIWQLNGNDQEKQLALDSLLELGGEYKEIISPKGGKGN